MRVFVIVPYLTAFGGAARFAWEFSQYLAHKNDEVTIVSLYTDKRMYPPSKNITLIDLSSKNKLTQTISFWFNLRKISKKIENLIDNYEPDVVLFNHFPSTLWVKNYKKTVSICYPHDINLLYENTYSKNLPKFKQYLWNFLRLFIRLYEKTKWKNFDHVIANSEFTATHLAKIHNIKPLVIYPGINSTLFSPKPPKEKAIIVIADHQTRRADFLLDSIGKSNIQHKDFKIWIVGNNGEYENYLKSLVNKYNLGDQVIFFGRVSDEKLSSLYAKALLLVHLQKIHPFGYIYVEAMSCGTPVIACKPGASEEVILHDETGFLINDNDSESLLKYILAVLENPTLSENMGNKGRIRVQQFFEKSLQFDKLRNFIINAQKNNL
jgi:glycosyltransferase involved in cell wall biosynthesis